MSNRRSWRSKYGVSFPLEKIPVRILTEIHTDREKVERIITRAQQKKHKAFIVEQTTWYMIVAH